MDNKNLTAEVSKLKKELKSEKVRAGKMGFVYRNEISSLKKELARAKGYHESASKEAKLFGYKSLGQLARFWGVVPETLHTYHREDRNMFVDIMKQCRFKLP